MSEQKEKIEQLGFMIGRWKLEYHIPQSPYHVEAKGTGQGRIEVALDGRYMFFDYVSEVASNRTQAHGVFTWDVSNRCYRFWWFESTGNFDAAKGKLLDESTLYMEWDGPCRQTFKKEGDGLVLEMECLDPEKRYVPVMKVVFQREQ